jgi:hypothetical protein
VIGHTHFSKRQRCCQRMILRKLYHFSGSCFSGGLSVIALVEQPRFFMRFRLPLMPVNTSPRLARLTSNPYSSRYNRHQGQSHAQKRKAWGTGQPMPGEAVPLDLRRFKPDLRCRTVTVTARSDRPTASLMLPEKP